MPAQVSFRLSEEEEERLDGLRGRVTRAQFAKLRTLETGTEAGSADVAQAQALVDEKNEEIARLKRELAVRPVSETATTRSKLPGLSPKKFVCSQCQKLNAQGRCIDHPGAKQKPL